MLKKTELEAYVLSMQMIKRGIIDDDEEFERKLMMQMIEGDPDFDSTSEQRYRISKGIVKRRNAAYKQLVDLALGEDAVTIERYIYHCISHDKLPDARVLTIKSNII